MMKRFTLFAVAAVATIGLVSACGSGGNFGVAVQQAVESTSAPAVPSYEPQGSCPQLQTGQSCANGQLVETPPSTTPPPAIDPAKFTMALKVMSKHCFGSAGCNVEVIPDDSLKYNGPESDLDYYSGGCSLTYQILGDESGEVVETAESSGPGSWQVHSTMLQTTSSKTKISAKVTDIRCNE
ncbi:hypothetical protein VSH64_17930 [Amycolatopsis rhabdoformis]|uniref:DUF3558 domain-containing protein n=1 Tax=Amycolatopsis rhabdoformis TaxID=1448059 RepID=A0ABZ1IIG9_9PSEU|nr:hypothetical protein [Amycolatopsis rhabdoformis]WSE33958.1 hypothetical protein VSH64_17930 [Amycolatopsis rhabdoformis]